MSSINDSEILEALDDSEDQCAPRNQSFTSDSNAGSESNLDQCVNNNYVPTKGDPNEQGDDIQDEQVEEYPTECVNILDPSNSEINYGAHNNLEQYMEDIHEETAEDNHDIIEDNHDEITDNNHDETTKDNYYDQLAEDNHDQLAEDSHDQLAEDNHDRQLFSDEGNIFIVITANQNCDEVQEDFLNVLDGTVVTIIEEDTQSINEGDFVTELSSNESVQTLVFTPDKSPHPTPEDEQIQQTITEGTPDDIDSLPVQKKPRKRLQTPDNWKINQRKRKHQAGEEYINQKGKLIHKKEIKTKKDCLNNCKFFCNKKITCDERQAVFKAFYTLKTQNEKYMFLKNLTERSLTARKQNKGVENSVSRRQFSFRYYFNINNERIQVCKTFFLSTLSISQKPIYNVHLKKDPETDLPKNDQRGHNKSTVIPAYAKNDVRIHIKSFPVVESHYCRKNSSKQYLDSSLNISKMYSLFVEKHPDTIIKESMYRRIFLTEFNMDFHFPKSDRCDTCEEHKVSLKEKLPADSEKYQLHVAEKNAMREARHKDRENSDATVLSFDLQNVITCPRAEISSFFYFSKLNVYNLTAHLKTKNGKKVYCALWTEVTGGRTGNDIASAVYKIVKKVLLDFPETDNLITWSDSCVPQNRNQMMTGAMMLILKNNPQLTSITMNYSTPGHGAVQEVDNIHSHIEKAFSGTEFFSPVSLMRILKIVNRKNPYVVLQMTENDFLDFAASSKELNMKLIPFTLISSLKLSQVFGLVEYNELHGQEMKHVNIKPTMRTSKRRKTSERLTEYISYEEPGTVQGIIKLKPEKKRDLKRMERFMPIVDREYYQVILNAH